MTFWSDTSIWINSGQYRAYCDKEWVYFAHFLFNEPFSHGSIVASPR